MNATAQPEAARASNYRWVVVAIWMVGNVWAFLNIESLGVLLPSISSDMGLTPTQEGLLGSAPRFASMMLAIPSGWVLSRFKPKLLTSVTFLVGALLLLFQSWAPVFLLLLLGRLLYGVTIVAREPARSLLMRQWVPPKEMLIVNSFSNLFWGLGAVGLIITPIALEALGDSWRKTVLMFAVVSFGLFLLWQILGKERVTPQYEADFSSQRSSPVRSILKHKELWLVALGLVGVEICFTGISVFWPTFTHEQFGTSLKGAASILAISGGVSSVVGIAVGVIVSRTGNKRFILWISGIILAGTAVGFLWTGTFSYLVLIAVGDGLGWAFFPIIMTIPFELKDIKPREIAVAVAFLETSLYVGSFIGPLAAGIIEDITGAPRGALMVTSLSALALSAVALLLPRDWDRAVAVPQRATSQADLRSDP